jgi:hypothetical protein
MKASYIAWIITLSGLMFVTLGHYADWWAFSYGLCPLVGIITSIALHDIDYK